jgi:hypothetical protein
MKFDYLHMAACKLNGTIRARYSDNREVSGLVEFSYRVFGDEHKFIVDYRKYNDDPDYRTSKNREFMEPLQLDMFRHFLPDADD